MTAETGSLIWLLGEHADDAQKHTHKIGSTSQHDTGSISILFYLTLRRHGADRRPEQSSNSSHHTSGRIEHGHEQQADVSVILSESQTSWQEICTVNSECSFRKAPNPRVKQTLSCRNSKKGQNNVDSHSHRVQCRTMPPNEKRC